MIGLAEAAKMLDYSENGLRDLVKRRRIKFFQPHKGCPVKFRPEWLAEFLRRASQNSEPEPEPEKRARPPRTLADVVAAYTREIALDVFIDRKYGGVPWCHACGSRRVTIELTGLGRCRACGHRFQIKEGTAAEGSSASLRAWIIAAWCVSAGNDSIPVGRLAAALRISRTAAGKLLAVNRALRDG